MKIGIAADHHGFLHKEYIIKNMKSIEWIDIGSHTPEHVDYPIFSKKIVDLMRAQMIDYGILLCGTGIGMAIAANRYTNIYAALVWNNEIAVRCKQEDNANVLVLPADFISHIQAIDIINKWLASDFKGGKYAERLTMIDAE